MKAGISSPSSREDGRVAVRAAGFLALILLVTWGVIHLFALRYQRGDIYPPGSTLRSDPLGTKVLAESLAIVPGFSIERNYRSLTRLQAEGRFTLVHLAVDFRTEISEDELAALESVVTSGARAIFTFSPELLRVNNQRLNSATPGPATPAPRTAPPPAGTPPPRATPSPFRASTHENTKSFSELGKKWGFSFDLAQEEEKAMFIGKAVPATGNPESQAGAIPGGSQLEPEVRWESALYFKGLAPAWHTIMTCNGVPVVIERDYGAGSIVLCSDTFFLTNEGMRDSRASHLVAHVFGAPQRVVFDEAHHGVVENVNVATLAWRLHLEGFVLALFAVVALFVWKNSVHFLPPRETPEIDDGQVVGRDSAEGFVNLLRRAVSPSQLLAVCVEEWRKARGRRILPAEEAHIESILRAHNSRTGKDATAAYRAIAEGLQRR